MRYEKINDKISMYVCPKEIIIEIDEGKRIKRFNLTFEDLETINKKIRG